METKEKFTFSPAEIDNIKQKSLHAGIPALDLCASKYIDITEQLAQIAQIEKKYILPLCVGGEMYYFAKKGLLKALNIK